MKHHATVQTVRDRYNSRREKNFLEDFFTTAIVPFTHALNRGVMRHNSHVKYTQKYIVLDMYFTVYILHMNHHAVVQSARERYISRREEILNNFLRIFSRRMLYRSRMV